MWFLAFLPANYLKTIQTDQLDSKTKILRGNVTIFTRISPRNKRKVTTSSAGKTIFLE